MFQCVELRFPQTPLFLFLILRNTLRALYLILVSSLRIKNSDADLSQNRSHQPMDRHMDFATKHSDLVPNLRKIGV